MLSPRMMCGGAALLLLLGGCARPEPARAAREAAVYAAYLDSAASAGTRRIVLRRTHADPLLWLHDGDEQLTDSTRALLTLERYGIPIALARDFVAANLRPDSVRALPASRMPIDFDTLPPLSTAVRDSIRRIGRFGDGFSDYEQAYPGARVVMGLSHVGFSPDGREALLYEESHCGMLCGGGALARLRSDGGRWRIVQREPLWAT